MAPHSPTCQIRLFAAVVAACAATVPSFPSRAAEHLRFEQSGVDSASAPAAFVYDPVAGVSLANQQALQVGGQGISIQTPHAAGDSFTIEAFAKPDQTLETRPRDFLPVIASSGGDGALRLGIRRSPPPHSYHWWQCRISLPGERPMDLARQKYRGISMVFGETPWRHLALTWDARTKTATFFLDYQKQASKTLTAAPSWSGSSWLVGHDDSGKRFNGLIDEVRVTPQVLQPWHFLRLTHVELNGVSFAPEAQPGLPSDYGHADVRIHYGAVGDGKHDDTEAIRRAFAENNNRVPNEYRTVYFPAGTYLISDTIRFNRFMVVRGAGRTNTIIKLKDRAQGYDRIEIPKPAFAVGYDWPYQNRPKKNRAGNVIGNYIFDLSVDTGSGNPSALGLDFHCNNVGCIENVDIRSGDGGGMVGLDLKRAWPGPCLIKNVTIEGFDIGIAAAHREYSLVFSGIQLRGQRVAAIANGGNVLSLENVVSENRVPAVQNSGGGLVVMINSQLRGGEIANPAIESKNASLYLRNIEIDGYGNAVVETRTPKDAPAQTLAESTARRIDEYFTGPLDHAFEQSSRGSLKLEVKQTPMIEKGPSTDWVNVQDFRELVADGDWAPAIQAAIDFGKPTVYFPRGDNYTIKTDVNVRGSARTFFGGAPKLVIGNSHPDDPKSGAAFVLDVELPEIQFEMLGVSHLRHESPTTVVFRHAGAAHISAGPACGDLFIEDAGGPWRLNQHQRVWARQLNPETKGIPEIINRGGQLWVLGMKTEYLSTKIENRDGAKTELLGGLMYPVHPVTDETLPMFVNDDSDISLVHGVSVYKKNHKIYMRDTQSGETREFRQWRWVAGRPIVNLYRSSRSSP